jgi:hypothetical protein
LESSAYRKQIKIIEPRDFRLLVTPAVVTRGGHDRFRPLVELLASGISGAGRHHAKLA